MRQPNIPDAVEMLRAKVRAHDVVAGLPIGALPSAMDTDARQLLATVGALRGPTSLGELMDATEFRVALGTLPRGALKRALDGLDATIDRAIAAAAVAAAAVPMSSAQRAEVSPWAAELGFGSVLERPLSQVPGAPAGLSWVTSGDVLLPHRRHLSPQLADAALLALRRHLGELGARVVAARDARSALVLDAPLSPRLAATLSAIRAKAPPRWLPYPASAVELQHDPPTARVSLQGATGESAEVLVRLAELERGELRPEVHRGGWGDVPGTALAAALVLRDAIQEPTLPVGAALREHLDAPPWRRAVQAYQRTRASRSADARVAFRVTSEGAVSVLAQRRLKSGAFAVGVPAHPSDLARVPASPLEQRIFSLLESLRVGGAPREGAVRAELLRALADHPRVYFGAKGTAAARIVEVEPTLEVSDLAGARSLSLRLGDAPPVPLARVPITEDLALITTTDPPTLRFASLGRGVVALARAVELTPEGFPPEADEVLVELAADLQSEVAVELPEALAGVRSEASPTLVGRGVLGATLDLDLTLLVRPAPSASAVEPGHGPLRAFFHDGTARAHVVRDHDAELALATAAWGRLPLPASAARARFRAVVPAALVLDVAAALAEAGVPIELPEGELPRSVGRIERASLRARISEAGGYFAIGGDAEVDEARVAIDQLLAAARTGRRFVEVSAGKFATISRELRDDLERLADVVDTDGSLTLAALPVVESLFDQEQLRVAASWRELTQRMRRARDVEIAVPDALVAELRDYQREGFVWMARLAEWGAGGCLADDMGLGKTVQTLALLLHRASKGPALVIAPTSVVDNWGAEAARFAPSLQIVVLRGQGRAEALGSLVPGSVALVSYDVALRDLDALLQVEFATLVLDEAQAVKNPDSKRARAVARLRAEARFALSGTPIENHLGELWSLYRAVLPGLFGSLERFRARFALPIERDRDPARKQALAEQLRPFLLRRTKEAVAPELPARTEVTRRVELGPRERARYEVERRNALAELEGLDPQRGRVKLLARLTRLRRLACDVRLVDPRADGESSKLASTLDLLQEILDAGHSALVFSQFTTHLALLRPELAQRGWAHAYLDGQTPAAARAREVARFQAGDVPLFLLSLKAGGTGLNLTAADYVLHLDPWWNPASEDQATDRAHRIGQDKPVTVVRLVTTGTIEEAVLALHGEKRSLARAVLEGGDAAAKLSAAELIDLVR